jgi:glycosyltransferase involved in cell wall biosynthesis
MQVNGRYSISVVTPVYNGEASIPELCRRLSEVLPRIATEYEIIFVNDDSRDRSWEIISELSSRLETVRGLNLMRNYGQHNALLCGIRAAKYDLVVTMDDDLQHPPEEISRLPSGPQYDDWKGTIKKRKRFPTLSHAFARGVCELRIFIRFHRRIAYLGDDSH